MEFDEGNDHEDGNNGSESDDYDEPLNLDEAYLDYQFSDDGDEDDDVASLDNLSEGEDEVKECRLKKLEKKSKTSSGDARLNVEPHELSTTHTPIVEIAPSSGPQILTGDNGVLYEHDSFLTELCTGYDRGKFVENEVTSDTEIECHDDEEIEKQQRIWPIHNPNTKWNKMNPQKGEKYINCVQLKACLINYGVANGYPLWFEKNTRDRLIVKCGKPEKKKSKNESGGFDVEVGETIECPLNRVVYRVCGVFLYRHGHAELIYLHQHLL